MLAQERPRYPRGWSILDEFVCATTFTLDQLGSVALQPKVCRAALAMSGRGNCIDRVLVQSLVVDVNQAGALSLAGFIRATAGRIGLVTDICGGVVVAGPVAVANAYVSTAIPTDPSVSARDFFDDAIEVFTGLARTFVLWAPQNDPSFASEAERRKLTPDKEPSPVMVVGVPTTVQSGLRFELVTDNASAVIFGDLCERGYE